MRTSQQVGQLAFIRGAWTGLAFLSTLLIGRWFGATVAGTYFLALSLITILVTIAQLGLDLPVMRWSAVAHEQNDLAQVRSVARTGLLIAGGAAFTLSVLAFVGAPWIARVFSDPELQSMLRTMAIAVPPWALALILGRAFAAVGRPIAGEITQRFGFQLAFLVLIVTLIGFLHSSTLPIAYAAAHWIVFLSSILIWHKSVSGAATTSIDHPALVKAAAPLLAASSTYLLVEWSDTLIIGYFLDPAAVGVYGAALRVSGTVSIVLAVATMVAGPRFAALHQRGTSQELGDYVRRVTRNCGYAAGPIFLVLVVAPQWIMGLFGEEFASGGTVLVILAAGQLVNAAAGPLGVLLVMGGKERAVLGVTLRAAAINVGLNMLLVPRFGTVGAAIATAASLVIVNGITMHVVSRQLGIRPFSLSALVPERGASN